MSLARGPFPTSLHFEALQNQDICQHLSSPRRGSRSWKPVPQCRVAYSDTRDVVIENHETLVKICGVTNPEDAAMAASLGADFIGMILWPRAKRSVPFSLGAEIAAAAREGGAQPVGVFVDEGGEDIARACEAVGVSIAQLHGDGARLGLGQIPASLHVTCVLHANEAGEIQTQLPRSRGEGSEELVDWILIDGVQGGSGEVLDWSNLQVPQGISKNGWILAGGLNPNNVAHAVRLLQPTMVDVSSGVTLPDKLRKDREKVRDFVQAVRGRTT